MHLISPSKFIPHSVSHRTQDVIFHFFLASLAFLRSLGRRSVDPVARGEPRRRRVGRAVMKPYFVRPIEVNELDRNRKREEEDCYKRNGDFDGR